MLFRPPHDQLFQYVCVPPLSQFRSSRSRSRPYNHRSRAWDSKRERPQKRQTADIADHMEASDVFRIAGVDTPLLADAQAVELDDAQKVEADRLQREMEDWRVKREATLEK